MNLRLVALARQILYFALFASGLRGHNSSAAARHAITAWATRTISTLLAEARAVSQPGPTLAAVDAVAEAVARVSTADDDARAEPITELAARSHDLLDAAIGHNRATRFYWTLERITEMAQRFSLTIASGLLVLALIFTSAIVRSVVLQSMAGLWSFVAFFVVGMAVVFGMRPLGVASFWSPRALPPDEWVKAWPPAAAVRQVLLRLATLLVGFVIAFAVILLVAPSDTTFRTPFVVTTGLCFILMVGHGLDTWDYFDPRPIRFIAAIVGAFAVWGALGYAPDSPWLALPDDPAHATNTSTPARAPWITADRWPRSGEGPIVVVAASGGGSRAATFAASSLLAIDRELPAVSAAIESVSGVSGGSLAMSGYVALRLGRVTPAGYRAAMETDYVWPLLRAIGTHHDRAAAVESEWRSRLSLQGVTLASLARSWNSGDTRFPVPILNSADMLGHPVLLSPFASRVFDAEDRSVCREARGLGEAWVCDRDASHTLQEIAPGMDVPLLSAARASANFPLAFPLIPVTALHPLTGHEHLTDQRSTRITDGGVFLNSGVQGLYPLLLHEREELRRRGVLLVVLDASATEAHSALPGEWEIMSALKGAEVGRGQMLHRLMITRLAAEFGVRFGCVLVDMPPTELSRIPTSWFLDDAARGAMRRHFTSPRWAGQRRQIEGAFAAVGAGQGGGASVESCLARPPLL